MTTSTEQNVLQDLADVGVKRALAGEPLARYTSWRIGGPADYLCTVEDGTQLLGAIGVARSHNLPWLILGGGNNILVSDSGVAGLVVLNRLRGLVIDRDHDSPGVECGAGIFFARAAQETARQGYTGMEWGVAIPGTVGAGVVNNAGAHASDVSRCLQWADVIDADGVPQRLSAPDLRYAYRQSTLKTPHTDHSALAVTACRFRLQTGDAATAMARVDELRQHRLRTQPVKEASAGSTFTNPPGGYAGALIEAVGLKGHRIGGAQISPKHANFIVNVDKATASDVVALIGLTRKQVLERCGIRLHLEVQFVGRWPQTILNSLLDDVA